MLITRHNLLNSVILWREGIVINKNQLDGSLVVSAHYLEHLQMWFGREIVGYQRRCSHDTY